MPVSVPEFNITDTASWGVAAHKGELVVNPPYALPKGTWVVDVENNQDGTCAGLGVTDDGVVIHFFTADVVMAWPKDFFKHVEIVGHNIKYDVQMLHKWGFDVSPDNIVWDTQIGEYVKDSTKQRYGLKKIVADVYGATYPDYKTLTGTGKKAVSIGTLPVDVVSNYCGLDVLFTFQLMRKQLTEMTQEQVSYMDTIELPTMRVLLEMEERGVQIDASYIRDLDTRFVGELEHVVDGIRNRTKNSVNLNSPVQVKRLLMDQLGLSLKSTAAEELRNHERFPLVKDILRYRELSKLRGTYTEVLNEKSQGKHSYRLHSRFNQTATHTGRLSSSEPNLQNIPTRTEEGDHIRKGFVAKDAHVLIDVDYSQIEPRLMAHFSQDPVFLQIFRDGKSIYDAVIDILGLVNLYKGDRAEAKRVAKVMWLALAYNAGAFKLSKAAGITRNQAQIFIEKMRLHLSGFFYWRDKVIAQAEIDAGVRTLFGRFIPLPQDLAHLGPNYLIQGTAAEIMKLAIQVTRQYNPVVTVHDELIFEVPLEMTLEPNTFQYGIAMLMEDVVSLSVPLKVETGIARTWSEAKS